jgi:predicted aldo/keto reductase-like oxidoreductase
LQFPYNIIENQAQELFQKAYENDIGVIVMKPLAGGAIDQSTVALRYVLNNPNVSVVIPGVDSVSQVVQNLGVRNDISLTLDDESYIKKIREELGNDFCRRCGYCAPCVVGIDIPSCFLFEGYVRRYGLQDWPVSRYETLTHKASECIGCRQCETRCPYNLKIAEKLQRVVEVFGK